MTGHAVLTWYPYDDTAIPTQPFWIIWAVCELVKETGNPELLKKMVSWQDGGEAEVLEHVKAAVSRLIADKGENGLVKLFFADWNDALNVTDDAEAESVMLSCQSALAFQELQRLMEYTGDAAYAKFLGEEYVKLKDSINLAAWGWKLVCKSPEQKRKYRVKRQYGQQNLSERTDMGRAVWRGGRRQDFAGAYSGRWNGTGLWLPAEYAALPGI